jgi:putative ABC transport system permease protein
MRRLTTVLGGLVAAIMAIGAVFGALNTMYCAFVERGREIATMRALGFSSWNVILSFLFEALLISLLAGVIGCRAVLPLNGLTTNTHPASCAARRQPGRLDSGRIASPK